MKRPDFTGNWVFNRERSSLQVQPPDSSIFIIHHREPHFELQRIHIVGETRDTFSIAMDTGGGVVSTHHRDIDLRAHAYWDGDVLVFHSELSKSDARATNIVRYQLVDNGRSILAVENLRSTEVSYTNQWFLEKQEHNP